MTRSMHPPTSERQSGRERFDLVAEGARYGLSGDQSLALWQRVCADLCDGAEPRDPEQARRRFCMLAARETRRLPEVGKLTRVAIEVDRDAAAVASLVTRRPQTPGRETLVSVQRASIDPAAHGDARSGEASVDAAPPPRLEDAPGRDFGTRAAPGAEIAHGLARGGGSRPDATPARLERVFGTSDGSRGGAIHAAAARGFAGPSGLLPHLDAIQASFGDHDVRAVRAHVGGAAALAAEAIGAHAYASGEEVAFASEPDLRLAAHEAAHVVQQRGGVHLSGGVGAAGDVYEHHADAVADLVVRGESAAQLLDNIAHGGSAGQPVVQRWIRHNAPLDRRVSELRYVLERRLHRLDQRRWRGHRSEAQCELEALQVQHGLDQIADSSSVTTELVDQLQRDHDARHETARLEEAAGETEVLRMRDELRCTLARRVEDEDYTEAEHERFQDARRALRALPRSATAAEVRELAATVGSADDVEPAPAREALPPEEAEHENGRRLSGIGVGHIEVRNHTPEDGTNTATVHLQQAGGSVENEQESEDGRRQRGHSLGGSLEMGADGVQGGDLTYGWRDNDIHGELTGGVTYYAGRPQRQSDGSYHVSWRVALRAGGQLALELAGDSTTGGAGGAGELTREGTEVFRPAEPTSEAALARARAFQASFHTLDLDAIRARFWRTLTADLGTAAWWRTAPVGTRRRVAIAGSVTPQLRAKIAEIASVGFDVPIRGSLSGEIEKISDGEVEVAEEFLVGINVDPSVGAADVAIVGFGMVGIDHRIGGRVALTFRVALDAAAFTRLLATHSSLVGDEPGVQQVSQEVEVERGEGAGIHAGPLGRLDGGTSESTITTTPFEPGAPALTTHGVREESTGNLANGAYVHFGRDVELPETADRAHPACTVTTDIHSTDGAEAREVLGRETGTHGLSNDRATSSGHWVVREELSESQMLAFHANFVTSSPPGTFGGGAYAQLRHALARVPRDATGDRRRAVALSRFLRDEGRRGLDFLQSVGRFHAERAVRLFGAAGEDPNFMSLSAQRALRAQIATYRAAARGDAVATDAGPVTREIRALEHRLAAVSNPAQYTDLPLELRAEVCANYQMMLDDLHAILDRIAGARVEATIARFSSDGQYAAHEVLRVRAEVEALRSDVATLRGYVIGFQRAYGQTSETEGTGQPRLDDRSAGITMQAWSEGEGAYELAEASLEAAVAKLDSVHDDTGELDAMRAYREASGEFDRARGAFQVARDALRRCDMLYRATRAAMPRGI